MNRKMSRRQRDIKSKLMAAICMLLVSSIMMVSTTYAWFTLSTAPEVTGITTAVGANGNLEMALLPVDAMTKNATADYGIVSTTNDSMYADGKSKAAANVTWGNLVDLAKDDTTDYGLDQITLYPSELHVDANGKIMLHDGILRIPEYGADGRVASLQNNTTTGVYSEGSFAANTNAYGVRAVGAQSGLTDRQMSFRGARAQVNSAMVMADNDISASLANRGSTLASIAVKYANNGEAATFDQKDVTAMKGAVEDLLDVLSTIDTAYKNAILAYSASKLNTAGDEAWRLIQSAIASAPSVVDVIDNLGNAIPFPDTLISNVNAYETTLNKVKEASTKLNAMTGEDISWPAMKEVLVLLANTESMTINDLKPDEVKANLGQLVGDITGNKGITVKIASGGGAYADIADHIGNYDANVSIDGIEYAGSSFDGIGANMVTTSSVNGGNGYLAVYYTSLSNDEAMYPVGGAEGSEAMPISDYYGYIIDLAFRTNAPESNLMLQVDPADRIYDENNNADTLGNGSTMTFKAISKEFTNDQIKNLMKSIKIVFFNPVDGTIIADARLNTNTATTGADGITAKMEVASRTGVTYFSDTDADGNITYYYGEVKTEGDVTTKTYKTAANAISLVETITVSAEGAPVITYKNAEGSAMEAAAATAAKEQCIATPWGEKIMPLTQNTTTLMSVLVYLDGTTVTNKDVAYNAESSMTGKMNLQFASSATLVPMEYKALHTVGDGSATYAVTPDMADGITFKGDAKATQGQDYVFELEGLTDQVVTYKVGTEGAEKTLTAQDGKYTIPASEVKGAITIKVAAPAPAGGGEGGENP